MVQRLGTPWSLPHCLLVLFVKACWPTQTLAWSASAIQGRKISQGKVEAVVGLVAEGQLFYSRGVVRQVPGEAAARLGGKLQGALVLARAFRVLLEHVQLLAFSRQRAVAVDRGHVLEAAVGGDLAGQDGVGVGVAGLDEVILLVHRRQVVDSFNDKSVLKNNVLNWKPSIVVVKLVQS